MLSSTVITSETYGLPPAPTQKGATSTIDSGDDRMQQTQYINGSLWGELTTSLTIAGRLRSTRAGAAWFSVHPTLSDNHIGASVIQHQGYVVLAGNNVIYPALQAMPSGNAAMVLTVTGADHFPSAAYAVLGAGGVLVRSDPHRRRRHRARTNLTSNAGATTRGRSWTRRAKRVARDRVRAAAVEPDRSTDSSNWGTRVLEVSP